jgi:hypothetical protein
MLQRRLAIRRSRLSFGIGIECFQINLPAFCSNLRDPSGEAAGRPRVGAQTLSLRCDPSDATRFGPTGKPALMEGPMLKNFLRAVVFVLFGSLAIYSATVYADLVSNSSAFAS